MEFGDFYIRKIDLRYLIDIYNETSGCNRKVLVCNVRKIYIKGSL